MIFPRDVSPSLYELIVTACLRAGFSRHTFQQAPQITTSLGMVAAGLRDCAGAGVDALRR
ncbi:Uncharacterised protein [Pantoea agglomerans]|uniref:Uncharacterized protein n=1 Tax=Enterobacter agglomerans TaxID=549 RepID=A0A379LSY1_ENTAG|nr:Uncharacterised protein [Pantoea agglomerans]